MRKSIERKSDSILKDAKKASDKLLQLGIKNIIITIDKIFFHRYNSIK